ncbi:hypothetical protein GCM10028806_05990 [Spirosoma terrae]|uniref:DUF3592 domain-containing protein n=1 Tax=Spirosoma terrae TaxID=1968276 RepID=A0A6L9LHX0_9BACT|nr:DUF3592 domain-containing protein [Spirosoma terrae]NDU98523.1 DUF3592 domain-containing protein [Spirosoma terrae]
MNASTTQSILEQLAQGSLSVAEAESYVQVNEKSSLHRLKAGFSWLLLLVFFSVGIFLVYHAWQVTMSQASENANIRETNGTVAQMVRKTTGRRLWAPVVTYQVDGKSYSFESEVASSPPAYTVGEQVVVTYDPGQPQKAAIKSFWINWLPLLFFGGLGGALVVVSLLGISALSRKRTYLEPELVRQTLVLVSTGSMSVQEGMARLQVDKPATSETKSGGWGWRIVIGGLLITVIYFSVQQIGRSWWLLVHGVTTSGNVVDMVRKIKGNTSAPIVRYSVDGKTYELAGNTYSSPAAYSIGDQVAVIYDPESPESGAIQSFSEQWAGPLLSIGLSVCFLLLFLYSQIKAKRSARIG